MMSIRTTCLACLLCLAPRGAAQVEWGKTVRGVASFYADKFEGRRMANGEPYRRDSFTCAHLRYPFGTLVHVRNPANGHECVVRVTDRGPYTRKYTIDLSKAAAKKLDFLYRGHTSVEITPVREEDVRPEWYGADCEDSLSLLRIEFEPIVSYPIPAWREEKK